MLRCRSFRGRAFPFALHVDFEAPRRDLVVLADPLGSIDSGTESDGLSPGVAGLAAGLVAGVDKFVVGFADPAGVLHPARAAIIARASNNRLNMGSPQLRQPTGAGAGRSGVLVRAAGGRYPH